MVVGHLANLIARILAENDYLRPKKSAERERMREEKSQYVRAEERTNEDGRESERERERGTEIWKTNSKNRS